MTIDKKFLTLEELVDYTSLKKSTIYKKTMKRTIPHIKAGKKLLFKVDAIDKWLESQNQPTVQEIRADSVNFLKSPNHGK